MVPAASVGVPDRFMDAGQIQNTYLLLTTDYLIIETVW